ncbi:hypothetical protein [Spartinivicinus poritis]|uniref:Uncharacterized protein n=1 Tax=Spartinivicinus poritis TaxID=2994640 RepID=A0ABT5UDU7_9GAMM|nr:hypothetical protein [Spartinivicinus sp. A2-2]MDE1464541.1 hypothetical protein [Spartinivicinus sp. A2-2]
MNINGFLSVFNLGNNISSSSQATKEGGLTGLNNHLQSLNGPDKQKAAALIEQLTSSTPDETGSLSALTKMTSFVELKNIFTGDIQDKFDGTITQLNDGSYLFQGSFNSEEIVSVEYGDLIDELAAVREQKLTNHSQYLPIDIDAPPEAVLAAIDKVEIENNQWKNVSGGNETRIGLQFLKDKFEADNGKGSEISLTKPEINKWITSQLQSFDYFGKINPNKNEALMSEFSELAMSGKDDFWLKTAFNSLTTIRIEAEKLLAEKSIVTLTPNAHRV